MKRLVAIILCLIMLLTSCNSISNGKETDTLETTDTVETEPSVQREDYIIGVMEDTYVYKAKDNGEVDNNFGSAKELQLKSEKVAPTRYTYLKFDISDLVGDRKSVV